MTGLVSYHLLQLDFPLFLNQQDRVEVSRLHIFERRLRSDTAPSIPFADARDVKATVTWAPQASKSALGFSYSSSRNRPGSRMKSILLPVNAPSFMPLFRKHCSLIDRRTDLLPALWEKNYCA